MRLLLCGGGTAGHITPALAVAEEIRRMSPDADILFVGREGGKENDAIEKAKIRLKTIKIQGLKRSLSVENIKRIRQAIDARNKAEKIIKDFRPDVILGTGGYVCWPIISAGKKLNIPTAIHESNIFPGLTTKILATKCNRVFLGYKEGAEYLPKRARTLAVGNPISNDFFKTTYKDSRRRLNIKDDELFILSFGGSIGAGRLNDVVIETMKSYSGIEGKIKHIHATGHRYFERCNSSQNVKYPGCKIVPYIENMPLALRAADIVICRCGAMTLAEIAAVGVAAILIPSPNVSGNHQYRNAIHFSKNGAAILIEEKNLSSEVLEKTINELKFDKIGRRNRAENIKSYFEPDSAKRIVKELFKLQSNAQ